MNLPRYIPLLLLLLSVASAHLTAQPAVSLFAAPDARLSVRQDTINFGNVSFGFCAVDSFVIENLGLDSLRIVRPVTLDDPNGEITLSANFDTLTLGPRRFIRIAATYCPSDYGCIVARIACESVNGGSDTMTAVGCAPQPTTLIGRDTIDFGLVRTETTAEHIYRFENTTDEPDTIFSAATVPGSRFTIATGSPPGGIVVPPRGWVPLTFNYAPLVRRAEQTTFRLITGGGWWEIVAQGLGGAPVISIEPEEIDFGDVPVGSFRDSMFTIHNLGEFPMEVTGISFGTSEFTAPSGASMPLTIPPDEIAALDVRFRPSSYDRSYADVGIVASDATVTNATARVRGRSGGTTDTIPSDRLIWLDTTEADVGDRAYLRLYVAPGLKDNETIHQVQVRIRFDQYALDPTNLLAGPDLPPGSDLLLTRLDDSTAELTIQLIADHITGMDLARLELIGLSTGKDQNPVSIIQASVANDTDLHTMNGLVRLRGCAIGRTTDIFRRLRIESVVTDGIGDEAIVRYNAPSGASGTVRLVDLSGRASIRTDIPQTSGEEEEIRVPLRGLPHGVYLLLLHVGEDWSHAPIFYSGTP